MALVLELGPLTLSSVLLPQPYDASQILLWRVEGQVLPVQGCPQNILTFQQGCQVSVCDSVLVMCVTCGFVVSQQVWLCTPIAARGSLLWCVLCQPRHICSLAGSLGLSAFAGKSGHTYVSECQCTCLGPRGHGTSEEPVFMCSYVTVFPPV